MVSMTFASVNCDADGPVLWRLHESLNRLSQYHLEVQLDHYASGVSSLIQDFQVTDVHQ